MEKSEFLTTVRQLAFEAKAPGNSQRGKRSFANFLMNNMTQMLEELNRVPALEENINMLSASLDAADAEYADLKAKYKELEEQLAAKPNKRGRSE